MQVPKRKPGKYTHQKKDPHMTEAKFNALKKNLERLKKIHPHLVKEVKRLALDGDFSENVAYSIAKGKLRGVNQKMIDIEKQIKKAVIIKKNQNTSKVQLGHKVTVEMNGKQKTFTLLGSEEIDLKNNIISHNSPIGSALIGKKKNEIFDLQINDKNIKCKILDIK